ncbi:MAG: ATPase, T2SS/T4P/T4SS family [Oscillospiraceae bacterium]
MMDVKQSRLDTVFYYLPGRICSEIGSLSEEMLGKLQEIRLRLNRPVALTADGEPVELHGRTVTKAEIDSVINKACEFSVYSYEKELAEGYITVKGGHRIGFCGTAVIKNGEICAVKNISALNIRIAREIKGCACGLAGTLFSENAESVLLVGPPNCGKTTLLRDLTRIIGESSRVSVVDERNEISASYHGEAQNDVGRFTDVFCEYRKSDGIMCAVRTMSPDFVVCDEIGGKNEADRLCECLNCGVKIICTAHAGSLEELKRREHIDRLISAGAFEKIVLLDTAPNIGKVKRIISAEEYNAENFGTDNTCGFGYICGTCDVGKA